MTNLANDFCHKHYGQLRGLDLTIALIKKKKKRQWWLCFGLYTVFPKIECVTVKWMQECAHIHTQRAKSCLKINSIKSWKHTQSVYLFTRWCLQACYLFFYVPSSYFIWKTTPQIKKTKEPASSFEIFTHVAVWGWECIWFWNCEAMSVCCHLNTLAYYSHTWKCQQTSSVWGNCLFVFWPLGGSSNKLLMQAVNILTPYGVLTVDIQTSFSLLLCFWPPPAS